jgi:serine/threonine protein kinase/WD40 repeat protein
MLEYAKDEKAIFLAALEQVTAPEREAYLQGACEGDPGLLKRMKVLLSVHQQSQGPLDIPSPGVGTAPTLDEPITERPGTIIGPYKLLEQIGEGGFGVVFMAEQTQPVRRKVALKVLKPGMDSRQVVARFEAERQALALMDHPNIAKVHDGGVTPSGRPYFIMELVKGVPITDFCDQNHLTPRERLDLFVSACGAVQHAHQKGIIHRDLKPSNVLVAVPDGTALVKIIDFGVAKALGQELTDKTLFTGFAQMIGTPLYMSPEQAGQSLDIDTRSDIYSLGVLLYELLTSTTPFAKERFKTAAYDEICRIIREEDPPRPSTRLSDLGKFGESKQHNGSAARLPTPPSTLASVSAHRQMEPARLRKLVRGELDWIVMKALEKDRNRRYETANSLARDVQRYLADEPVQACPPKLSYRFRKLVRRNKALFATATLIAATLLVASAAVTWKWRDAEMARRDERSAKVEAEKARDVARDERDRTRTAERTARLHEAEALVGQAHGTRLSRQPGQRFEALAALGKAAAIGRELDQPPEWFDRLRNEAIAALALPDIHITQEFGSIPPGSDWVELSRDFEYYVRTMKNGSCTVRRVADDTKVAHLELGEPAHAQFGTGRILAVAFPSRFQLWDFSGDEPALRFEKRGVKDWEFHPNGRLIAMVHGDGFLSVYDVATGARRHRLPIKEAGHPAFHPTEPFVATTVSSGRNVWVYDLRTGAMVASALGPGSLGNGNAAWSPDGRTLTVPSYEGGAIQQFLFDPAAPALRPARRLDGPDQGGTWIVYNPAGDRIVRRGWDGLVHLFDAVSGQLLFSAPSLPRAGSGFDRTGQRLAGARVGDRKDRIGLWSVADGHEYRALLHSGSGTSYGDPAIHRGGRLAAQGVTDGLALFDLRSGRELDHLPISPRGLALTFDGTGSLLSNGFEGCFRWPVRPDPMKPGRFGVGPPERLPFNPGHGPVATSHDGRVVAQGMWAGYGMHAYAGGWILHPNSPTPRRVEAGISIGSCSVSPDGRWVAFGGPYTPLQVYDAATAQRVFQSPVIEGDRGRFSPDGHWLATNTDGGRVYAVGSWEPGPQLGPGTPWDVTPELAVLGQSNGIYRLVALATGRELARLEDPEQNTGSAAFTPDGTRLVVKAKNGLRIWDLRRIRAELAKLGLDWDAPPYLPGEENKGEPHLQVITDFGLPGRSGGAVRREKENVGRFCKPSRLGRTV